MSRPPLFRLICYLHAAVTFFSLRISVLHARPILKMSSAAFEDNKQYMSTGSPTSGKKSLSGLDSPITCHADATSCNLNIPWTPRQSPRCRNGDEDSVQNAVAALLGTPRNGERAGKGARKKNGKHTPTSDDEGAHSPPPAAPTSSGTQFTWFPGTKVRILTQKALQPPARAHGPTLEVRPRAVHF